MNLARMLGKPVMLYANGIGPVRKDINRSRVRKAVEQAAAVTLRDHSSAQELREMGVNRPDLVVTADPVFRLESAEPARAKELLLQTGLPEGRDFVAVSVRDWEAAKNFPGGLAALCDHLRREYDAEVLFLLMQPEVDRGMTEAVRKEMQEHSYVLDVPTTPREMMAVLGQAKLCLAMRLHTLIFAARMAVPTLGLVYDPKVASFLQELELPSAGDVEHFDAKAAIAAADGLMGDYDNVLARLRELSGRMEQATRENVSQLLRLLEQPEV